jgi:hypothetical protein
LMEQVILWMLNITKRILYIMVCDPQRMDKVSFLCVTVWNVRNYWR